MSYVILAKGDKKAYLFFDAIIGNGLFFLGNVVGYYIWGLEGVAYSYLITSFLIMSMLLLIITKKYKYKILHSTYKTAVILLSICMITFFINHFNIWFDFYVNLFLIVITLIIILFIMQQKFSLITEILGKFKR
jgi:O-antigen/teichoic acid export membrane protein